MYTFVRPSSFANYAGLSFALSSIMMVIAVTACTAGQSPTSIAPLPASSQSSSAPSSVAVSQPSPAPTQPAAPTVTAPTAAAQPTKASAPAASPTPAKSFKGFRLPDGDPCKLLAQADVERALGKPIKSASAANDQNTGAKGCFYLNDPGKSFFLVTYWQGDDAKMQLLGSIAQLQQKGDIFSGGGTTRRVTPTPLPPAVAALKPKSLVELFGIHAQLSKEKYPSARGLDLSGLGEGAAMDPVLGNGHIVAGEVYLVFFLADSDLTEQKRIEGIRLLAASLFK